LEPDVAVSTEEPTTSSLASDVFLEKNPNMDEFLRFRDDFSLPR
jgi:hypothetical protein